MQDMTNLLRFILVLIVTAISVETFAQGNSGEILGTVTDEKNEPIINAVIQVSDGTGVKGGAVTDFDGQYVVKPLAPGAYTVSIKYIGYNEKRVVEVLVKPSGKTEVNAKMNPTTQVMKAAEVIAYEVPLIDKHETSVTKTGKELSRMPTRNTTSMVSTTAGAYSAVDGGAVSIGGARANGTLYIVDGVQVYGSRGINMSQDAIGQMQVITSGLPAKYGDALGGVVNITTRGVSRKLRGGVMYERSIDGYGHNLANFNLSGPLWSKKEWKEDSTYTKKPLIGFFLAGDFWYDQDRAPRYHGNYVVKEDKVKEMEASPLVAVPNQSGVPAFRYRSENLTANDLELVKRRPNASVLEGRMNGRLDFQLAQDLTLSAGGTFNYARSNSFSRGNSYITPQTNATRNSYTGRGFLRLQQSFNKKAAAVEEGEEEASSSIISNAFYTIQVDYQREYASVQHPDHGRDLFKYGYIGKFNTEYTDIYAPGIDSAASAKLGYDVFTTRLLVNRVATNTTFERSEINPLLANYTSQYYSLAGDGVTRTVNDVLARNGLINGSVPGSTYGIMTNVGATQTGYSFADVNQYAVSVDASFDLKPGKTRHSIEFGLYYQQRTERSYGVGAANTIGGMWTYMRQLVNSHIGLDYNNPVYIKNGQRYSLDDLGGINGVLLSPSDTTFYNTTSVSEASNFAKNLRAKLGVAENEYVNIDGLDPATFDLEMFNADELLNSGNPWIGYSGYDVYGNKQKGQVNFNDFFTKKDANGNYTRDIGSYRPNYLAGYVQDRFDFKDISFNIGVRVERFDANTKVLKDPYSLYEVNTVADARKLGTAGTTPEGIGDDYVVYVNNNESNTPSIIGYRNGDDWYDPTGKLIQDPTALKQFSGGRDPQPYLVDNDVRITDTTFDPNSSFTDYKPQINVMPRIKFSFPISDVALFYAHYDVLVQRPKSNVFTRPSDYYFLTARQGGTINNPNLKPEKMFDYELGFKQKLSKRSAITIAGFYKERKDMIQIRPYLYAWPTTYYSYGNRDFSTTKGMIVRYDMRRTGNLRLNIDYTLQFANGTGSGTTSSVASTGNPSAPGLLSSFISAGLPNVRTTFPLNVDVRHNIVTTIDYRYKKGGGPVIAGKHILELAGANLIFRTRSGEPYTRYTRPRSIANTVDGQVFGSRLPWHYWMDFKLDKDFTLKFRKDSDDQQKRRRQYYMNVYVLINNLLNTRDILGVDGYTGRPDDNGYLLSPQGRQVTQNQFNPQSFVDMSSVSLINGAAINLPRRINVGVRFNF